MFLTVTLAPATGPPCSSVMRPERVAPETWARAGLAERSAKARASDRQIHFAKEEVQPLFNISFPLARSPVFDPVSVRRALARKSASHWTTSRFGVARM